mgnify:CR=1 FL=1|nr:hypothetical protein [uncultured Mediterranean phage uvMED]
MAMAMANAECKKCGRPTRLESEMFGFIRAKNGVPDWPVHIWNKSIMCDSSPPKVEVS